VLADVGFAHIRLLAWRPPRTLEGTQAVAAELWSFCDEFWPIDSQAQRPRCRINCPADLGHPNLVVVAGQAELDRVAPTAAKVADLASRVVPSERGCLGHSG
jgi:hypothetical protein